MKSGTGQRDISLLAACLPLGAMVVLFAVGALIFEVGGDLLLVVMLAAAGVSGWVAVRAGSSWEAIQRSTGDKLGSVLPAILILLSIGMLIGTWVFSGTIPLFVYYGIRVVDPSFIVLTAFLATAVMSLCTGTSWGSAGTIGVALMGMAGAMGAPPAATAGAVVSGAYFGDKLSPLSDSTNICAIGAKANLYDHVWNMLYTAIPSFVAATFLYLYVGLSGSPAAADGVVSGRTGRLLQELAAGFHLTLWPLLPPLLVVLGTIRKYPAALVMTASSGVAMAVGVMVQGFSVQNALVAAVSGFRLSMLTADAAGFSPLFRTLVERGGLSSMANTLLVIIAAFLLAGAMDVSGALDKIISRLLASVRSTFGLVASNMLCGATMISLTSHGGVTALIIGGLFQKAYRDRALAPQNLSRALEDSVTIVEPLMPWTVSAIFMATTLSVSTLQYLPWAVFCYLGPVFSLLYGATYDQTGFGLKPLAKQ